MLQSILQMVNRVGAGFCPEPQPAGPHHIARHTVTDDLDRILMQDQPSKFYYVITGAHGLCESCCPVLTVALCKAYAQQGCASMNMSNSTLSHQPWQGLHRLRS